MKRPRNHFALVLGLCLILLTAISADKAFEFYNSSVVTTGRVVRLQYGKFHPVVEFFAMDGSRYEALANTWWSVDAGQAVNVRYTPDNPAQSVKLDRFLDLWIPTMFLALLASFCVTTGLSGEKFRGGRF
ncbi:DUF3592 domain-containing protein [Paraburkholderia sp. MMS20-SJTR3]|uniref:DUF3592 domain-containing protein n=1 Tax=Paraburkholderia sejongensis TaxID=2886946 RepID=A0ABS8K2I3_9BURK|nr:DUF3592 domain-containing protein [Paraburkholderia sp. MMS20-SJTR3]